VEEKPKAEMSHGRVMNEAGYQIKFTAPIFGKSAQY
jgi:hypothetical protein